MKGAYRSGNRLAMDLLGAIDASGPVGVTRLMTLANLTHGKLQEMLAAFEQQGWVEAGGRGERLEWILTAKGSRVLLDLRRVDAVMQDHGLGL